MKKIILPALVCLFTLGSLNATNTINTTPNNNIVVYNVSSFCKLIQKGNYEVVKYLVASGEDINQKSKGLTPLMYAARHNKAEIIKLLINNGAKLHVKSDKENMTALELAKKFKAREAIKAIESFTKK